jgi:Secreted repeat of unknown function
VTYTRHPLYPFVKDTKAGQTAGQGVTAFGAPWYALSAAGDSIATPAGKREQQQHLGLLARCNRAPRAPTLATTSSA